MKLIIAPSLVAFAKVNATAIKLGMCVVLLSIAGLVAFSRPGGESQLDTPESASIYVCPVDGATRKVTPAGFERMLDSGEAGPREGATGRIRGLYVRCPKCKHRVMVLGKTCEKDGAVFPPQNPDGSPAACPKCGSRPIAVIASTSDFDDLGRVIQADRGVVGHIGNGNLVYKVHDHRAAGNREAVRTTNLCERSFEVRNLELAA